MASASDNQIIFLRWLAKQYPQLYNAYVYSVTGDASPQAIAGIFDSISGAISSVGSFISNTLQQAPAIIQSWGTTQSQLDLIKTNLARVQNGQPLIQANGQPVSTSQLAQNLPVGANGQPLPISTGLPSWVLPVALAGLVFLLMKQRR